MSVGVTNRTWREGRTGRHYQVHHLFAEPPRRTVHLLALGVDHRAIQACRPVAHLDREMRHGKLVCEALLCHPLPDTSSISVQSISRPLSRGPGTTSIAWRSPGAQLISIGLSTGNIVRWAPGVRRSSSWY